MTDPFVLVEAHPNGVARVRFNRPPLNPLSHALLAALTDEARALGDNPEIKAVVVAGGGPALPAGGGHEGGGPPPGARNARPALPAPRGGRGGGPPAGVAPRSRVALG